MGEIIKHPALQAAESRSDSSERDELLFAFAAVRLGLEHEGNLTSEARVALRRCLVEAGLTESDLSEYLRTHREDVRGFLADAGLP